MRIKSELYPTVLFENPNFMVVVKPAGLLSQGEKKGEPNVVDWARQHVGRHYIGLVHRLDRNTSGLMVVAKRTKAARRLTEALQRGDLRRTYLAWLEGRMATCARWHHWLVKDPRKNKVRVFSHKDFRADGTSDHAKEAVLSVKPLRVKIWNGRPFTLAEFELETGRSHQIRAQAAWEGYPVAGDAKYGDPAGSKKNLFPRTLLHSHKLFFPDPISGKIHHFQAPVPEDMRRIA